MTTADVGTDPPPPRAPAPASDTGPFAGLPIWSRIIAIVGIPGAITLFSFWMGSQYLPQLLKEQALTREAIQALTLSNQQVAAQSEEQYRLLQKICSVQSKTEEQRLKCFER